MTEKTYKVKTSKPVLVTGATGYVAGWIVKRLLDEGVTVHAAVRDPGNREKVGHLMDLAERPGCTGRLKLFKSDLLEEGSYKDAMEGCSIVFHTASPFRMSSESGNPQEEFVEPAVKGTANVLGEAVKTRSVKRVVLTSSVAAIFTDATETHDTPTGMATEEKWNDTSSLDYQPYYYSKTLAEEEAWKIVKEQAPKWDLVVINPSLVVGPGVIAHPSSESFRIIKSLADGTYKNGCPEIAMGCVDVRDVAAAHLAAAFTKGVQGRHIVSAKNTDLFEMCQMLDEEYKKEYPIARKSVSKTFLWLVGPWVSKDITRSFISNNVGVGVKLDNSKSIRDLGIAYRPMEKTINEMFAQMVESGMMSNNQ